MFMNLSKQNPIVKQISWPLRGQATFLPGSLIFPWRPRKLFGIVASLALHAGIKRETRRYMLLF